MSDSNQRKGAASRRPDGDRLPPHNPAAERSALGCVLLDGACLDEMIERHVTEDWFYELRHQAIYKAMRGLAAAGRPVDTVTLFEWLVQTGPPNQAIDAPYLVELDKAVPSAANLPAYLEILREKWMCRRWIALCTSIVGRIFEDEGHIETLSDEASQDVFKLCESATELRGEERSMRDVLVEVKQEYLDKFKRGVKRHVGPQTGFNYLDNIIPGFAPGTLNLIAARPSMGKSALMLQVAANMAGWGVPVGVVSLEMTARALAVRALFEKGGADMVKFLNGFRTDDDPEKLAAAYDALSGLPIVFIEEPRLSVEELGVRARRMVRKHDIKALWVDYFQLLFSRNRIRTWNRQDELSYCSSFLKALGRELGIPVFALAQMNREIEKETHRRPKLSDLRDTGQLEQDADTVIFLWKPNVTTDAWKKRIADILPRVPVQTDWRLETTWKKNLAFVLATVEKQREGPSHEDATLVFIKPWTRFVDAYTPAVQTQQELDTDGHGRTRTDTDGAQIDPEDVPEPPEDSPFEDD